MIQLFCVIEFHHISQMQNHFADALATLAVLILFDDNVEIPSIEIGVSYNPAYCLVTKNELDDPPWYYDIKRFLQIQKYPIGSTQTDRRT